MSQALFPMALFGSIAGGFIYGIVRGNKDVDNALAEAEKKHPGFLKFYERFREAEDKADAEWRSRAFKGLLGDVLLGFVEGYIKEVGKPRGAWLETLPHHPSPVSNFGYETSERRWIGFGVSS